jgi:anion-transporting  ArsA/GET3 family ATPase
MKKVYLILGSGGVGKTTVAASLGLALAEKQKGALFTVDPSLRLCQTLGLERLSLKASVLCEGNLEAYGLEVHEGLTMILEKVIKDPERVQRIIRHRLFSIIEGNISHLEHFLAMDKVVELVEREDLDFLVVDTPPHDQAFEFFETPKVLSNFLDKAFLRILLDPSLPEDGIFTRFIGRALQEGWKLFRSLLGEGFWQELSVLLQDLMPLRERLVFASERMNRLLHDSHTQAILVSVPEANPLRVAQELSVDWKNKLGVNVESLVLNRSFPENIKIPTILEDTLFYQKWLTQNKLIQGEWFRSFKKVYRLSPLSPFEMKREKLQEMGRELC